jgi:hypothetical protein
MRATSAALRPCNKLFIPAPEFGHPTPQEEPRTHDNFLPNSFLTHGGQACALFYLLPSALVAC